MAIIKPVNGTLTQPFGCTGFSWEPSRTWHGNFCANFHGGIDWGAPEGTPIWAAAAGWVREVGFDISIAQGGGNAVWLQHNPNFHTVYVHCSALYVSQGQNVPGGATIAAVGSTGLSTGNHLHFAVWTITTAWGFDVDDPSLYMAGGANAGLSIATVTEDVPTLDPFTGQLVTNALCVRTPQGLYAPPSRAQAIKYVYFDGILAARTAYDTIVNADGSTYIDPVTALADGTEVRADYIAE